MIIHTIGFTRKSAEAFFASLTDGPRIKYLRGPSPNYIILPSTGTSSSATMLMILIKGLIAGPAVSL
jgi:hypothetical protein